MEQLNKRLNELLDEAIELDKNLLTTLPKSILQEAIQGKLVSQKPEEGTAEELLAEIRKEKELLVKEGKLKKSALTDSVIFKGDDNKYWEKVGKEIRCIDDEIPFEIPKTWAWVRLYDICSYIQRGKSPKYSLIKKYPVIAQKCNQWSGFSIDKAQFIEPSTLISYGEERLLQDGDLMWNSTGLGTLGRMAIYWSSLNPYGVAVADSHVTVIRTLKQFVLPKYLYYYFSSNTVQSVIEDKADGSTKQKELSTTTIKGYILPLPPLVEQQRIVARIEELASIMSRYNQVAQIECDYDFPDNWTVARLSSICTLVDGEKKDGQQICLDAKYLRGKSAGDYLQRGRFVQKGDNIILVDGENSGEVFTVPCDGYMGSTFKQLWVSSIMHLPYVLNYILFYKELLRKSKRGAAIPHLNKEIFYSLIIGIPPHQEQIRIVNKINEIYSKIKA